MNKRDFSKEMKTRVEIIKNLTWKLLENEIDARFEISFHDYEYLRIHFKEFVLVAYPYTSSRKNTHPRYRWLKGDKIKAYKTMGLLHLDSKHGMNTPYSCIEAKRDGYSENFKKTEVIE